MISNFIRLTNFPFDFKENKNFVKDMVNVAAGIVWQTALAAGPIYLVVKDFVGLGLAVMCIVVGTIILKKNWYNKLED